MTTDEQPTAILPVSSAQTFGHYRINAKLGAGAMGEVYLATDTRLDRNVALKMLPAECTQDAERVRRFMQESKAASALNHPNIITVYDIGECEAGRFLVMELVAGRTLRAVIAEDNSTETLLTLGAQMAKALSAAHAAGITHRDIKPDNIMVREDGYVKVLDFGLARLRPATEGGEEAATLAQQTTPGTIMGTVAYMSPEQARGESVSHPSDIFALGIVLYELATGRHPFKAETLVGYLHAITLQTPAPPQQWQPMLPAALNELLLQMLAKDARQRPTASEVAQALQAIERGEIARAQSVESETMILPGASQPLASPAQSIAVLPFANISADEENEYFCDGLAEELLNALAKIDELKVAARTSAFSFKGKNTEAREIGKTLNVNTVLEGSVRKAGHRIRINVQLVNAADGYQLWSERYDREMKDIFDVQDEITLAVVDALKVKLLGHEKAAVLKKGTVSQKAYELYLKGRFFFNKFTRTGIEKAIEFYEQAIAIDANYALAYVGISDAYFFLAIPDTPTAYLAPQEALPKVLSAAERAIELDDSSAEAWAVLAHIREKRLDLAGAKDAYQRSFALDSKHSLPHSYYAAFLSALSEHELAIEHVMLGRELDPLSFITNSMPFLCLYYARRYDESISEWEKALKLELVFPSGGIFGGLPYVQTKRYAEAIEIFRQAVESSHRSNSALAALGHACAVSGNRSEASKILSEMLESSKVRYVSPYGLALVYVGLSEKDKAIESLITAYEETNMEIVFLNVEPRFDPLRDDPRFQDIIRRIGFPTNKVQPSAETQTLRLPPITDGKPAENALTTPASQRHTVGRERERNELLAAFKAANDGRGSLLCVAGEPGIGKTTLVEDFLAELAADNQCTIARGRCSERLAGTEAYLPLLEALESLLEGDNIPATTMKQLAPTWYAQIVPLTGDSEESARLLAEVKAASQERMKRELAAFLTAVATPQPLVIFFDDLHWADVSTIDLLSFLAGKFDAMRVLIVVTYRPSDMLLAKHPFLQIKPDLQARGLCREMLLEFLTAAEIADYLALEFPRHSFPRDFARLIHAKTEGSPLFMADLVRYLRGRGVIAQSSGTWMLAQTLPDIERELPESVRGMIERKLAQLSEEDRKLLTAASVQGYEFDSAVVAQVLNLDADEVEERLEKLERVFAFVKLTGESEFPNRTLTLKYRFVHVLYQNALYATLRATRKVALSRTVAETREALHGKQREGIANELALLWEAAREYARSADYFRLAAQQAVQVFASQESVTLARRGMALLQHLPDNREQRMQELSLQVVLGNSLMATRGYAAPEVEATYARARELCQELDDTTHLLPVLFGVYAFHNVRSNLPIALELGREFLSRAEQQNDPAVLVGHRIVGMPLLSMGQLVAAREQLEVPVARYVSDKHRGLAFLYGHDVGMASNVNLGVTLWLLGYPDQGRECLKESLRLAREVPHAPSHAYALYHSAALQQYCRAPQQTLELAEAAIALATEQGLAMWLAWATVLKGWTLAAQNNPTEGIAQIRQGLVSARRIKAELYHPYFLCLLAEAQSKGGQIEEGLAALDEAQRFIEKNEERYWEAEVFRLRGELLLRCEGREIEAEACFQNAQKITQQQKAKSLELRAVTSLVRLWQRQGQTAEARQMLTEVYGWFTEGFDTADLQEAKALLDELR
jgi:serine/threonine protein kinase/predicted ATPase